MRRREFITLVGSAAAWPLAVRAQQPSDRMRRVGVLMNIAEDDPQAQGRMAAFLQGLQPLGWIIGRNLQIDARWVPADAALFHRYATELVALRPEVILASTSSAVAPLRQATRTIPIVFVLAIDPVAAGDVASLARPSGNATGFLLLQHQRKMAGVTETDRP